MKPADLLQRAQAAGLLPAEAQWPAGESGVQRPWPVLALIALGAWFVAVPLLAFIAALLGPLVREGLGMALIGAALLALSVTLLRARELPLFVEQLALPLLLAGLLCLGFAIEPQGGWRLALVAVGAAALGLAVLLPPVWLRGLLGLLLGICLIGSLGEGRSSSWWGIGALLVLGWATLSLLPWTGRLARLWEALGGGLLLAALLLLALCSGSPWLVSGLSPLNGWMAGARATSGGAAAASALLLAGAAAGLAWRQPALRSPAWGLLALPALGLALLLPALGALALAGAVAWQLGRARLALAAGAAALWVLGAFYYALQWPLIEKAGGLALLGLLLALWTLWQAPRRALRPALAVPGAMAGGFIMLSLMGTLGLVNQGIAAKERLLAQGQTLFVRLAPVDPRSLMQGDYMRLAFELPQALLPKPEASAGDRPVLVVQRDGQQRAEGWRADTPGQTLAAHELRLRLGFKGGRWMLVSDAWFFREGEAERWQGARWGEFRVAKDGEALLVGLRDERLQPL